MSARHVARPRLTTRLGETRAAFAWAGGGSGKTALAAELRDVLGVPAIEARLDPGDARPGQLVGRLRRALRRAGRSDALLAVEDAGEDPRAAVEAFVDALAAEADPVLVVVDDVHHTETGGLLGALAAELPEPHRLLVLGRVAPAGLTVPPGAVELGGHDLAFTAAEVAELADGLAPDEAEAIVRATGGWAAAVRLALARLERGADVRELTEGTELLAHLVDGLIDDEIVQLAHLPLIGEARARRALAAGLPLTRVREGWLELSGGVQEHLAGLAPLRRDVAADAAREYLRAGEVSAAVTVLLRAGDTDGVAALVAGLGPDRVGRLDFAELRALVEVLPAEALERHPRVLLHYAQACQPAAQLAARDEALARAAATADPVLRREVDVERALDHIRDMELEPAERLAQEILDAAGEEERATRARALDVLGRVAAQRGDPESLAQAEGLLEASLVLSRALNQQSWVAQTLLALAFLVLYVRGEHAAAVERIDELLAGLSGRSRYRSVTLSFRATILIDAGRHDEAEATFAEIARLAAATADDRAAGYLAWSRAQLESQRGDARATLAAVREAEAHASEWFSHQTGAEFLAEAADLLDRVGEHEEALRHLERARARAAEAPAVFAIAEAAVLARSGEPAAGRAAMRALGPVQRRDRWRMTLLEAHAARRAGDPDAAALAARAFEEAAAIGAPQLPFAREAAVAAQLAGAPALVEVGLLGGLRVTRGGARVDVPDGTPRRLLAFVAAAGGRAGVEEAIEALWPGAAPDTARRALRNALHRLRAGAGELVERDGDRLRLVAGATVDALVLERDARAALHAEADAAVVLARFTGDVLPGEPLAEPLRRRLRELQLGLLDRHAEEVEARGELDEALRALEQAIALDPYDERRYLMAARILAEQGRRGRALQTLTQGADALRDLGLPVPPALSRLAEVIAVRRS